MRPFADHLGVAVRTVAYWRKQPGIHPRAAMQEVLDTALECAPDRVKAQFALLADEACRAPDHQSDEAGPSTAASDSMTDRKCDRDNKRTLWRPTSVSIQGSAVECVTRHEVLGCLNLWLRLSTIGVCVR
jgi:8-oxo-dGTP diphosphatase